ncbi:MAG: rod shape-determining protein MreC [Armatimonadetes bacterium]|nr:rod shape-determining protein MreC [Armatimonadota bacterium]MDE2207462.1 rod shape-determining protein MreC [Armatimonadota bacterium]
MNRTTRSPWRRAAPLLLFVFLGTLAGVWHNHAVAHHKPDITGDAVRSVAKPVLMASHATGSWFSRNIGWLFRGRSLAAQNRRLEAVVGDLRMQNAELVQQAQENSRLRADLGFVQRAPFRLIGADVIALRPDPDYDTLLIDRGSTSGVHSDAIVVTGNGLVGRIFDAGPQTASVLLLSDANSAVGARVQRADSNAIGVVRGSSTGILQLTFLPLDADIKAGDTIVTSGIGGVFPPGITIGTVVSVRTNTGSAEKTATIHGAVDLQSLDEVYVRQ